MVTQDEKEFWGRTQSRSRSSSSAQMDNEWPSQLGELPTESTVPWLPAEMIPAPLRSWLVEVAERACFPLEFVTVPALVGVGTVIGRGVGVMPSRFDDFLVIPNLWGAIIARPGMMKTFAVSEGLRPLKRLAATAHERYSEALQAQGARRVRLEAEKEGLRSEMVKAFKKGTGEGDELEQRYLALQKEIEASTVVERRYYTHDATVESFDRLLNENPRGLLVVRDELAGWLMTFTKPGREGDREFFLEAWNGTSSFTRDRIGRGTVHIDAVTLSVFGGIQPGKLRPFIEGAVQGNRYDDGLLQRLQMLVWPDDPGPWVAPQAWLSKDVRDQAYAAFTRLDQMDDLMKVAARLDQVAKVSDDGIPYLRFAPGGQELFDAWRAKLELRLRSKELAATPAFEAHIAKYRSLMPSLALIFHLLTLSTGDPVSAVSLEAASDAADWCDYLEQHARKVYSAELSPGVEGAKVLVAKIKAGAVQDYETVREIARHQWASLNSQESVHAALRALEKADWVRIDEVQTAGRPSEIVRLHPVLRRHADA